MPEPIIELCVSVERVLYPQETVENASWFILQTSDGVCKGNMAWRPRPQERLRLTGSYGSYQGKKEFKFTSAELDIPTDSRGMLHYVCEMASGVGSAMEAQIWELKGEDWASVQDGEIPRLTGKIWCNLMEAIERAECDRAKGAIIAELLKAGATMNMAAAAYETWGDGTIGVVQSNPYRLAELPNYGFSHVDGQIRVHFGIGDSDPRRIRAAVVYVLRQLTESGSTLIGWEDLNTACLAKLGGYQDLIIQSVSEMFQEGTLKGFKDTRSVSLASDYRNEFAIWEFLNAGVEI